MTGFWERGREGKISNYGNQCFHNFAVLSVRDSSRVISAGMTPRSDFAISTRSALGLESFATTLPLRVIKISSLSASCKYLPRFSFNSVAVIDMT